MTANSRQPLRIQTRHDDRVVVLECDSCDVTAMLRTTDPGFALAVQAFFDEHADCVRSLDLTEA